MISIDPNALYSMAELRERLADIVDLPTLLERLELRDKRVFRDAVWGWEILEASKKANLVTVERIPVCKSENHVP